MLSRTAERSSSFLGGLGELTGLRRWAAIGSGAWIIIVAGYALGFLSVASGTQGRGTVILDTLFFLIALILPLILIWVCTWMLEELRRQREMVVSLSELMEPLAGELMATRRALSAADASQAGGWEKAAGQAGYGVPPELAGELREVAAAVAPLRGLLSQLNREIAAEPSEPARPAEPVQPRPEPQRMQPVEPLPHPDQPHLPSLEEPGPPERPVWDDLIRALDFPRDEQDFEGFRALQAVLKYRPLALLLQAAEDVLTLLSQEGAYMDDIAVGEVDPDHWRRFLNGERGPSVAGANQVADEHVLELARGLLKSDTIFRDTALFFQRRFDKGLSEFLPYAGEQDIARIAGTRSGRAFMLLAGLSGAFE